MKLVELSGKNGEYLREEIEFEEQQRQKIIDICRGIE
jgi:hypothetical protein